MLAMKERMMKVKTVWRELKSFLGILFTVAAVAMLASMALAIFVWVGQALEGLKSLVLLLVVAVVLYLVDRANRGV